MKRIVAVLMSAILAVLVFAGCQSEVKSEYSRYEGSFFDSFDTLIRVLAYSKSEEEFETHFNKIQARFQELHKYYDIYNDYEGINNIKTINDNAGIKPVKVSKEIIDLIQFSKDWYNRTNGRTNIAMGAVLKIWHDYREEGRNDPENAKLPPMDALKAASEHTDINKVIVDVENSTVYLEDKEMSLDVGAVAKGYATELIVKEVKEAGFTSAIINAGGNVRVIGKPLDGVRERWGVGIQDPDKESLSDANEGLLDTIFVTDKSVVSSGDYERYYYVGDKAYHHIIDPNTLMPGNNFRAVTIVTEDSGLADLLSTAVFLMPYEEGKSFVEGLEGVDALWIMHDGKIEATEGMKKIMKSNGASGADK